MEDFKKHIVLNFNSCQNSYIVCWVLLFGDPMVLKTGIIFLFHTMWIWFFWAGLYYNIKWMCSESSPKSYFVANLLFSFLLFPCHSSASGSLWLILPTSFHPLTGLLQELDELAHTALSALVRQWIAGVVLVFSPRQQFFTWQRQLWESTR